MAKLTDEEFEARLDEQARRSVIIDWFTSRHDDAPDITPEEYAILHEAGKFEPGQATSGGGYIVTERSDRGCSGTLGAIAATLAGLYFLALFIEFVLRTAGEVLP
jgi:hypothetical protein